MIKQVDLTIKNQDWSKIRTIYDHILNLEHQGKFEQNPDMVYGKQFNLGNYGTIIDTNKDIAEKGFILWQGPLFESALSWAKQARQIFSPLDLRNISWSISYGNVMPHIDRINEITSGRTKINYIVSTEDPAGLTVSYDKHGVTSYPSTPNNAWLLDTAIPHAVIANGIREVLTFRFGNSFEEISNFLDQHGPIVFGND
jgi:hypothetical protein